ncbi:MAG: heavy metal translocating P-type ATPase, partial [candidate division Zixibacteria bacterium]
MENITLKIDGMHCASCVHSIESSLTKLTGVGSCSVNLAMHSAAVEFDSSRLGESQIISEIERIGFSAEVGQPDLLTANEKAATDALRRFLWAAGATLPLMVVAMGPMITGTLFFDSLTNGLVQAVLAGIVLFYCGRSILSDALTQTRHFRANMNSLIAIGSLTAYGWSFYALGLAEEGLHPELYFESAGMIITFILAGRYMEARAKGRASDAIRALWALRPSVTTAVINNVDVEIEVDAVREGMILRVKPGERIPADGIVAEGNAVIDESMLTGESLPVEKQPGHKVVGGSLNTNVPFTMTVTATGEKSYLASVIRLVAEAQSSKAPIQRLADRVASVFVPIVLLLALLTAVGWYFYAPDSPLLIKSTIAVLIIACPCALGLATPTAVLVATGFAAREGIIVRGGDILEQVSDIDTVIFDKTGTLTYGELEVVSVKTFGRFSEQAVIRMVGSIEAQS